MSIPKHWSLFMEALALPPAPSCPLWESRQWIFFVSLCWWAQSPMSRQPAQNPAHPALPMCQELAGSRSFESLMLLLCYSGSKYLNKPANREPRTIYGVEVCCTRRVQTVHFWSTPYQSKNEAQSENVDQRTIYWVEVCCTRRVCKLCIFGASVISLKMRHSLKMWNWGQFIELRCIAQERVQCRR